MVPPVRIRQSAVDACPGALRMHAAADGPLARVRIPGGMLTGAQLAALTELAHEFGDGWLELTSRANVQLRALNEVSPAVVAARLWEAGMLPSEAHETVRNIAAPPLAGEQIRGLVRALDEGLCADPELAALPGRFLFAIGRVPVDADVAAVLPENLPDIPKNPLFAVLLGNVDVGLRVPAEEVVPAMLAAAHAFLTERAGERSAERLAWRIRELPDGAERVARSVAQSLGAPGGDRAVESRGVKHGDRAGEARDAGDRAGETLSASEAFKAGDRAWEPVGDPVVRGAGKTLRADEASRGDATALSAPIGVVAQGDGLFAVGALVPLGRLGGVPGKVLAKADSLVVTTGRGIVVRDLSAAAAEQWKRDLAAAGLEVEPASRWVGVTACAGRPGCAKALADVRADAEATSRHVDGLPVHWVGCARGCGSPAGAHVRVEATNDGYVVSRAGEPADADPANAEPADVESGARQAGPVSIVELGEIVAGARRS